MVRFFCPRCWADFAEDLPRCPKCGLDIQAFFASKDYVDRLILALGHPLKETALRAATVLGKLQERRAVGALISTIRRSQDIYLTVASARALGEIGTNRAMRFLVKLCNHSARTVREQAARILAEDGLLPRVHAHQDGKEALLYECSKDSSHQRCLGH